MKCPYCGSSDNGVSDSREAEDGLSIRRRRKCTPCGRRFTTYERVEESPLFVVKRDGRRQLFDRRRILAGLERACEKRPVAPSRLEQLCVDIERRAGELGEREVPTLWIGERVMDALRALDEVAYVRFASVYRSFRDVEEFARELVRMRSTEPAAGPDAADGGDAGDRGGVPESEQPVSGGTRE